MLLPLPVQNSMSHRACHRVTMIIFQIKRNANEASNKA